MSEDDDGTAIPTPQVVEEIFTREGQLFEVLLAGRVLRTTPEHPFFVQGQGWTAAGELQPGNLVSTATGEWLVVESVTDTHQSVTVYNFRVSEYHTYFIAPSDLAFDVWVHNSYGQQVDDAIEAGTLGLRNIRRPRGELHHIATDKDALFAPQFEALFNRAGISLQHPLNITRLPGHVGPHKKFVNQVILDRLVRATEDLSGTALRSQLLDELWDLRRQIHNTDFGDLFKAAASRADVIGKY